MTRGAVATARALERAAMKAVDLQARRERYVASTPRIVVRDHRDVIRPARLGEVGFRPGGEREFHTLGDPTPRKEIVPDTIEVLSNAFRVRQATSRIRRMAAADALVIDAIDDEIARLQRRRREVIAESFRRGHRLTAQELRDAGATNRAAREREFKR